MAIPWLKLGENLLNDLLWIQMPQGRGDNHGSERVCILLQILVLSLREDCKISDPDTLAMRIQKSPKTVQKVCEAAINRGIIQVLEDGSYSTSWLIEKGYVGVSETTTRPKKNPKSFKTNPTTHDKPSFSNPFFENFRSQVIHEIQE